jgi:hypothetical protein
VIVKRLIGLLLHCIIDTECIQTLQQPCISVWSVASLPNNDIVVGGSDATVRLYTRSDERTAKPEDIKVNLIKRRVTNTPYSQ